MTDNTEHHDDDPLMRASLGIIKVRALLDMVRLAATNQEEEIEGVHVQDCMQIALDQLSDVNAIIDEVKHVELQKQLAEYQLVDGRLERKPKPT